MKQMRKNKKYIFLIIKKKNKLIYINFEILCKII